MSYMKRLLLLSLMMRPSSGCYQTYKGVRRALSTGLAVCCSCWVIDSLSQVAHNHGAFLSLECECSKVLARYWSCAWELPVADFFGDLRGARPQSMGR